MPPEHDPEATPAPDTEIPAGVETPAEDVNPSADSSAAGDDEAPTSLLDVLKDVVQAKEEPEPEASSAASESKDEPPPSEDPPVEEMSQEEQDKLPFARHPRFRRLLSDVRVHKGKATELQQEVDRLTPAAKNFASIEQFMQVNGLETKEVLDLFKLGAMVKNDPDAALTALYPILTDLRNRTGHNLPQDLATQVEEGRMTEEAARELSVARARTARLESDRQAQQEREQAQRAEDQETDQRNAFQKATQEWVDQVKTKDPDFGRKEQLIADRTVRLLTAEGRPKTPEAALEMVKRAYKEVSDELRSALPPKQERKREATGTTTTDATPIPQTMKDALSLALRRSA